MSFVLKTTSLSDVEMKRIQGQLVFDFFQQVKRILIAEKSSEGLINFFAEPVLNQARNEIVWFSPIPGGCKSYSDCSEIEKKIAKNEILILLDEFTNIVENVAKKSGNESTGVLALKAMLVTPNFQDSIFLNQKAVIFAEWGCVPFGATPNDYDLILQREKKLIPIFEKIGKRDSNNDDNVNVASSNNAPSDYMVPEFQTKIEENTFDGKKDPANVSVQSYIHGDVIWRIPLISILLFLISLGLFLNFFGSDRFPEVLSRLGVIKDTLKAVSVICRPDQSGARSNNFPNDRLEPQSGYARMPEDPNRNIDAPSSVDVDQRLADASVTPGQAINISLAWQGSADLDLEVVEPSGQRINFANKVSQQSGGSLDVDANKCQSMTGCPSTDRPVENISWNRRPSVGRYAVRVSLYSANALPSQIRPISFTVVVTHNGEKKITTNSIDITNIICEKTCHSMVPVDVTSFDVR